MATITRARAPRRPDAPFVRAFTLPVQAFDTLKAHQRTLQFREDQAAREAQRDPREITNSAALADLLRLHSMLSAAIAAPGIPAEIAREGVPGFVNALYFGEVTVAKGPAR